MGDIPGCRGRRGPPWLLTLLLAASVQGAEAVPRLLCAEALAAASPAAVRLPRARPAASPASEVTALVVFTGFQGQRTDLPAWADSLFDLDRPGSVSHFYREMSFGSFTLRGAVAPRRYLAPGEAIDYAASGPGEVGRYADFVQEILRQVDGDLDLAGFDNDGPDGRPDSGDDDGEVDLLVLITPALPRNFLLGGATGIGDLGLLEAAATTDPDLEGHPITYRAGLVAQGRTFPEAAGTVAHELGHTLFGLLDLYDLSYQRREEPRDPADDSAGIGNWGLMGRGALGWGGDDGPVSFSAWSRLRLGWSQVTETDRRSQPILLRDVAGTGELVRIPAGGEEYFLLEYRTRSSWYDRGIPAQGLLIWHVMSNPTGEVTRAHWLVDLECADGRWKEGGFPLGQTPDPLHGGDNLDFWAGDDSYARAHGGNLGDATDVYGPGGRTEFTADTNPSSADREGRSTFSVTGIEVTERGVEARIEIDGPWIEFEGLRVQDQTGDGVLVAGEEAVLRFDLVNHGGLPAPPAILALESLDGLLTAMPERHELPTLLPDVHHLGGVFETPPRIAVSGDFASSRVARLRATVVAAGDTLGRRDMQIPVISARQEGLEWQVRDWQGTDRIDPGDLFHMDLRLQAKAPGLLRALNFYLSSPGEGALRVSDGTVHFAAEGLETARSSRTPEFLALAGAAGTELPFVLEVRTRFQVWTDTAAFGVTRRPDVTPPRVQHLRLSPTREGLVVHVRRRHILEGSEVRRVDARVHGLPDSTLRAEVSMVERDAVYEAAWEGPAGTYSVSVVAEDANGNVGESEASRIEVGAAGEPPRVVEPGGPDPGGEPYLAGDWRPEGPDGQLQAALLQVHAGPGGTWYGRTEWRVWRSPDEGASWQPATFMLSGRTRGYDLDGRPIDVASTVHGGVEDPLTAYVVEGGASYRGFKRIFSTLDGGVTWSAVPMPEGVDAAFVDSHLPDRLYAASDGAVFVSDHGGRRWTEFPVEGRALGVWSHPADPGRTYAWVDSSEGWGWGGRLWRLDGAGARAVGTTPVLHFSFFPVPDPWTPGGFYVSDGDSLHHTSDEGTTWRAMELDVASDISGMAPSDSEPGLIYGHTRRRLFRSHDSGETWQGTGARFDRFDDVESVSAFGPAGLLIQTLGGVHVSTDRGETAFQILVEEGSLPAGTLWFDVLDRLHAATVQSRDGERYMGIHRLEGGDWEWLEGREISPWFRGPHEAVFQDPWAGEVLIAHLAGTTGYLRSTTGGDIWLPLESSGTIGLPYTTHPFLHRPSIFADLSRPGVTYLADAGLWISFDHGESWERMGPYLDREERLSRSGELRPGGALLASRDSLAVLYGDSLWVGHKDGWDWRVVGRLEPGVSGLDLARHPDEPGLLYAAADAGCFVSGDGGRSWRRVLEPRSGSWQMARLRGHPRDADALYLAADRELYHSPDRGATWRALDPGYPGVPWINDVAVDPLDPSTLYVATSAGLFSMESPPTSIAGDLPVPWATELMSSYPNPFNAGTIIPFRLAAAGRVRIDIYNLLGQRVRRLLDERRAPGRHKVRWPGTDDGGSRVSSGVYFYRLTTGQVAETRRCMLIR